MAFNIQNFVTDIGNRGTLKNNSYDVFITEPPMLRLSSNTASPTIIENIVRFRANKISLPGINLDLTQTKRYGVGPVSRAPTNVNFTNMGIEFLETANHEVYKYLYEWTTTMFDYTGAGGGTSNPVPRYNNEYAKYYTTDVLINVYRQDSSLATKVRVIEAFPISISDKSLSWDDTNSIYKVDAAFAYKEWRIEDYETEGTPSVVVPDIVPVILPP